MDYERIKRQANDILLSQSAECTYIEYKASSKQFDKILKTLCAYGNNYYDNDIQYIFVGVEEINAKIVEMLRPEGVQTPIQLVFQSIDGLRTAIPNHRGDWYFTGHFPTPGGTRLCNKAFVNYYENVYSANK